MNDGAPTQLVRANIRRNLERFPSEELRAVADKYPQSSTISSMANEVLDARCQRILEASELLMKVTASITGGSRAV